MNLARRLLLFLLGTVGAFVYLCNTIPQIKSEPVQTPTEIGKTPEDLVSAGKRIFISDRAPCLTCHSLGEDPKARCPNQEGLGERAPTRKLGMSAAEYLVESVYDPNAFVVPGYPRNQMTPVNKPPIALTHDEILAVIAFLNSLGGKSDTDFVEQVRRAQEPWRRGLRKPEAQEQKVELPILPGEADRGRQVFKKMACIQCHSVGPEGGHVCPDLATIGSSQRASYIFESILQPSAIIVKGYKQMIVLWKDQDREDLSGITLAWLPDKNTPRTLKLSVGSFGMRKQVDVDLEQVACVGDTVVAVHENGVVKRTCGNYVDGDDKQGITLSVLDNGRWVQKRVGPEGIQFANLPMSPMPENFAEMLTPHDLYDLVAYLLTLRGQT